MPINIPNVPDDDSAKYQLLGEVLRRAIDGTVTLPINGEPMYVPNNATSSGRRYRIQIIEVTDPDTLQISPVIQVIPA